MSHYFLIALDSAFDMYFSDLDTDYIFVDPNLLTGKICEHIVPSPRMTL